MINNNTPRIGNAFIFIFFALVFGTIMVLWDDGSLVFGFLFFLCLLSVLGIFGLLWFEKVNDNWESMQKFAESLSMLDDVRIQAFGLKFPKLRLKNHRGLKPKVVPFDCEIAEISHFAILLMKSDRKQVFPKRHWYGKFEWRGKVITLEREQWDDLIEELLDRRYIIPDSAQGNHSYLWATSEMLYNLRKAWHEWIVDEKKVEQFIEDKPLSVYGEKRNDLQD